MRMQIDFQHTLDLGCSVWAAGEPYDAVSSMFGLGRFFRSEASANCLMQMVAENLKLGGHFFGVVQNGSYVHASCVDPVTGELQECKGQHLEIVPKWKGDAAPFGSEYSFKIKDTITEVRLTPSIVCVHLLHLFCA